MPMNVSMRVSTPRHLSIVRPHPDGAGEDLQCRSCAVNGVSEAIQLTLDVGDVLAEA